MCPPQTRLLVHQKRMYSLLPLTRYMKVTAFLATLTEVRVKTDRNRVFTLDFTAVFTLGRASKTRTFHMLACGSAALGDESGDGERAVATPLFHGKNRSQCRSGSARLRLAPGSPPPFPCPLHQIFGYYASNTAHTLEEENSVLLR